MIFPSVFYYFWYRIHPLRLGKAKRLKQAKEEAQDEIEKYRKERERQFKEFEMKHMGSREDVAARIDKETNIRIAEMNKAVQAHKEPVSWLRNRLYTFVSIKIGCYWNFV